ncbi:MAG TPA: helix-turn-helix domain-containing protein, partial [Moorella mulderi]|nr:helix-turn-helix domain-containing protein [Moorella mulderi]
MEKLGDVLRSAREAKGFTLEEVEEATKIRQKYLKALEEGDYSSLPGRAYALGFARSYARYLGLDIKEITELFKQEYPQEEGKMVWEVKKTSPAPTEGRSRQW